MEKKFELLTASDFFQKLQSDNLDTHSQFSITGIVKKSENNEKSIEFAPGGNCLNWVTIPLEFIDGVEVIKTVSCKDHSHPLVRLKMKTPETSEGKIFLALLERGNKGTGEMQHGNQPDTGIPDPGMEPNVNTPMARLRNVNLGGRYGLTVTSWVCKWVCTTVGQTTTCGWVCGWESVEQ